MANESKHTSGPWQVISFGTVHLISQQADTDGGFAIGKAWLQNYHPDGLLAARIEAEANARLIAAAPIGYQLAEETVRLAKAGIAVPETLYKLAQQFIAKATGN